VRDVPVGGGGGGGATEFDLRTVADERELRRYAIALEHEIRPTERTGLVLGYARHWLDKEDARSDDAGATAAAAHLDLTAGTRLRVAAARTIRFPTIRQLYEAGGGDPTLRTERATTAEAGVEQALPARSSVALTLFRTDVRDYIERPAQGEAFANHDEYLFAGVEAAAETRVVPALLLRARYTYLDTEDRSPGRDREALQYRPRHRGTLEGRYAFRFGLHAALAVTRVADQVYYSRQDPVVGRRLPDYTLANARLEQRVFDGATSVYLGADNLLDEKYEEEYGSPQATRTLYGGITVRTR
jgi:outer membrane receptor protein involved in Fe transport